MKLVTYLQGSSERAGIAVDDVVLDLEASLSAAGGQREHGRTVLAFVQNARIARPAADRALELFAAGKLAQEARVRGARLLAPIPRPPSMRDGYAFRQHVETARRNRGLDMIPEFDQFPVFYFTNHQAVVGPGPVRVKPRHLERLDFELEAAIVVGRQAHDLTAANADEVIFGMTIMNDFSARALQMDEMKLSLGPAKGKDFATGLGPYLVTMDELGPATKRTTAGAQFDLGMRAFVNGVQVSTGNV